MLTSSSQQVPVEMLRFCIQASLFFSSIFYIVPFAQSWHRNKHTVIRYYEIRKKIHITFALSVFLHSSHHLTFRVVLWHIVYENWGGWGPEKWRRSFSQGFPFSFLSLSSLCCHPPASWSACSLVLSSDHHFDTSQHQVFKTDPVLLWKTVWQFLKKQNVEVPCCLPVPLLYIHTWEHVYMKTCTWMFIAALLIIAKE